MKKTTALSVEKLGKKYEIGEKQPYLTLRESITNVFKGGQVSRPSIWALKDVSFTVEKGEVVGIIGKNGAGKSTLLKILSQITPPTEGTVTIHGRVASLLEVGTGFHSELTGRENIYLNGAILGLSRKEIHQRFEDIIEFSGVKKFIDTPVKRYSSGMYVRLAFSVAAHLEPDILIVDEVLSVGDAEFQKKSLGKMENATQKEGRTIIFVSHNMGAIRTLCNRVIVLDDGKIVIQAETNKSLRVYNTMLKSSVINEKTGINDEAVRRGSGGIRFTSFSVSTKSGNKSYEFKMGDIVCFHVKYRTYRPLYGLKLTIGLRSNITREMITTIEYTLCEEKVWPNTNGEASVQIETSYFRPGEYPLYIHIGENKLKPKHIDVLDDLTASLTITESGRAERNFDPRKNVGYFSVPSELISNNIKI